MKHQRKPLALAAAAFAALALAGCETIETAPGVGPGPSPITPPTKASLPSSLPSADGDQISVSGFGGNGQGPVTLCLTTRSGMWKKSIRVSGGPMLTSENGTTDCGQVQGGFVRFQIIKAKFAGVMTPVGNGSLDLTGWGGGRVTISWNRD